MFSVVIPNLHSPLIDQVIDALDRQSRRDRIAEIIVVGRGRPGHPPAYVRYLETDRPVSAAAARNLGARSARGDRLLFLDSDCIADRRLIEHLQAAIEAGHTVICGGIIPEAAAGTAQQRYWSLCDNLLVFVDYLPASPSGPRASIPSLNLSLPRALFLACGGFDQSYAGAAGEDLDFGLRLREQGYTLSFIPGARIRHAHRRGSAREVWQHLRAFGRVHRRVARTHPHSIGGIAHRLRRVHAPLIMSAALPLAIADTLRMYCTRRALWPYLRAAPGVAWARVGWYWGLAEGLLAEQEQSGHR